METYDDMPIDMLINDIEMNLQKRMVLNQELAHQNIALTLKLEKLGKQGV